MLDHTDLVIGSFRGLFDRSEEDTVPFGYFRSSQNLIFLKGGVETRYGCTQSLTIGSVKRAAVYKRIGEAQRLLILDGSGNLYDSTNLSTPILTIAAMTDFSMVSIFGRAYITPHNGLTGLPGEKVYVYTGAGVARPAAGTPPSAFTLTVADSAASGNVEAGERCYAVAYETSSGFITAPGGFKNFTSAGGKKATVGNLPIGGSHIVARHIMATKKLLLPFNGDFESQEYFFVPDGRVGDNSTVTFDISFFDAQLQDDATFLMEQVSEIPAGVGIGLYRGKMITWGEDANPAVVRVSEGGEPESMNEVEGFVTVNPGDSGGGVKNCTEYRNQLVMCKSQRTYYTQDRETARAAFWEVGSIDMAVGTECHGFGKSLDFGENIQDVLVVADRPGLRLFTGTFSDDNVVTWNVDGIWSRINQAAFHTIEVAIDPVENKIYIAIPLDAATAPSHILYGDWSEGIAPEQIRWGLWSFPRAPQTVIVDVVNSVTIMKFGAPNGNIYEMDPDALLDFNNAIDSWVEFPLLPVSEELDDAINHFGGIRLRIRGAGTLQITGRGLDDGSTFVAQSLTLAVTPGRHFFRGFNFVNERCSVKLRVNLANEWFRLTKANLLVSPMWEQRSSA